MKHNLTTNFKAKISKSLKTSCPCRTLWYILLCSVVMMRKRITTRNNIPNNLKKINKQWTKMRAEALTTQETIGYKHLLCNAQMVSLSHQT